MRKNQPLPYPLRIQDEYMAKLKIIAKENGRSVNKEIETLIKNHIIKYEECYGTIIYDEEA